MNNNNNTDNNTTYFCLSGHGKEKLFEHILKVMQKIREISREYNIPKNIKKYLILLSIFHDIGKCEKIWQKQYRENKIVNRPHALFSSILFYNLFYNQLKKEEEEILYTLTYVILTHHRPFSPILYKNFQNRIEDLQFEFDPKIHEILSKYIKNINRIEKANVLIYRKKIKPNSDKVNIKLYSFLLGILKEADYKAVSPPKFKDTFPYKNFKFNLDLNPLQKEIVNLDDKKVLLIQAPTGIGKTEASLLYANKFNKRRLFYTIPISFAINVMKDRLQEYFPNMAIDIYHHWSHIFRILRGENEIFDNSIFSKRFFNAVNIIAPDLISMSLLKSGDWPPRLMSMYNSTIIFDECHLYDPVFLWFIIYSAKKLYEIFNNINFVFMSATAPSFLNDIILQEFGKENVGIFFYSNYDINREKFNRGIIEKGKFPIFKGFVKEKDLPDLAIEKAKEGKKVLIVRNSVTKAQELYREIIKRNSKEEYYSIKITINSEDKMDFNIIYRVIEGVPVLLAHRRFTFGDRFGREEVIQKWDKEKRSCIIIATQIVEVSLDIDFDVLITDIAPIPALVQRLGRVNRKRNRENTEFYIIEISNNKDYWKPYKKDEVDISKNIVTEFLEKLINKEVEDSKWLNLVNKYYEESKNNFIRYENNRIVPPKEIEDWIRKWIEVLYPNNPIYLSADELEPLQIIHDNTILDELLFADIYRNNVEEYEKKIENSRKNGDEKEAFKYYSILGIFTVPVPYYLLKDKEFTQSSILEYNKIKYVPYDKELGLLKFKENDVDNYFM